MPRRKEWSAHLSPVAVVPLACHNRGACVRLTIERHAVGARRRVAQVKVCATLARSQPSACSAAVRGCARLEGDGGGNLGGGAQQIYEARVAVGRAAAVPLSRWNSAKNIAMSRGGAPQRRHAMAVVMVAM